MNKITKFRTIDLQRNYYFFKRIVIYEIWNLHGDTLKNFVQWELEQIYHHPTLHPYCVAYDLTRLILTEPNTDLGDAFYEVSASLQYHSGAFAIILGKQSKTERIVNAFVEQMHYIQYQRHPFTGEIFFRRNDALQWLHNFLDPKHKTTENLSYSQCC